MLRDGMVGQARAARCRTIKRRYRKKRPPISTGSGRTPGGKLVLGLRGRHPAEQRRPRPLLLRQQRLARRRLPGPGPPLPAADPARTPGPPEGEVAGFAEAVHVTGGVPVTRLFAMAGRYVRRWDGDTGRRAGPLPGPRAPASWRAAGRAGRPGAPGSRTPCTSPTARAPIGHLWRYQGGAWTDLTAAGAPPAAFVLATGPELWRVCGTADQPDVPFAVSKCEADPTVPANWTAPIPMGDASRARHRALRAADAPVRPQGGRHGVGPAGGRRHRHGAQPDPRPPGEPRPGERQAPRAPGWAPLYFRAGDTLWRFTGAGGGAHRARAPGGQHLPRAGPRGGLLRVRGLVRPGGRLQRHA